MFAAVTSPIEGGPKVVRLLVVVLTMNVEGVLVTSRVVVAVMVDVEVCVTGLAIN